MFMPRFLNVVKSLLAMSAVIATVAHANLPNDVYTGYWAMSQKVLGEYIVVEFKKQTDNSTLSTVHHFVCNANGTYHPTQRTHTRLIPKNGSMAVYEYGKNTPTSYLKVFHYTPKQKLFLTQSFTEQLAGLKQAFPDDMILIYYPTNKLAPTCGIEPRP